MPRDCDRYDELSAQIACITENARQAASDARRGVDDGMRALRVDPPHRDSDRAYHQAREQGYLLERDTNALERGGIVECVETGACPQPYYGTGPIGGGRTR